MKVLTGLKKLLEMYVVSSKSIGLHKIERWLDWTGDLTTYSYGETHIMQHYIRGIESNHFQRH